MDQLYKIYSHKNGHTTLYSGATSFISNKQTTKQKNKKANDTKVTKLKHANMWKPCKNKIKFKLSKQN